MAHLRQLVLDNFYPDPAGVRSFALRMKYEDAKSESDKKYYKGLLTTPYHPYSDYGLILIQEAVARPIATRFPVGEFRLLLKRDSAEEVEKPWVHYDSSAARYSALVYLNSPEQCLGGTSFYKHVETGLYHLPEADSPLARHVMEQFGLSWDDVIAKLAEDGFEVEDKWELVTHIPMAFNRCLMFDGRLFHARTGSFGTTTDTGRLTQNFFFD